MNKEIKEMLKQLKMMTYDENSPEIPLDLISRKAEKILLDYITNLQKENEKLKKPLIPSEKKELIDLLYKDHLSNKNKKKLEDYITRLHNYNEHLLKINVEKDYKLVEIENEIDIVKNAYITGGNLNTLINKLENILDGE